VHLPLEKLGVTPDVIEGVIIALSHMLTEGAKLLVNEVDFMDSLLVLNLPEPICKALCEVIIEIQDHRHEVRPDLLRTIRLRSNFVPAY
jgi:hypothetical protein